MWRANTLKVLLTTSYSGVGFNHAPSLGLHRLQYFLHKKNIDCDILDLSLENVDEMLSLDEALIKARKGEYQIIGMSVSHYHMADDLAIIFKFQEACKNNDQCIFIAGGQEATYNYEQWMKAGIDVVFLGYAERNLAEFASQLQKDWNKGLKNLKDIDGVVYRQNDNIIFNPTKVMTQSEFEYLNYGQVLQSEILYPIYWDYVRSSSQGLNYGTNIFISELVRIYASSNCPNNCGFCSSHSFIAFSQSKKAHIFMLNAEQIYNMILHYVKKYGAKGFLFSDDEFLLSRKRGIEFCDNIINAKKKGIIDKNIMFNCQARVTDFLLRKGDNKKLDYELMEKLVDASFHSISLGVETFSDRLLKCPSMNKRGYVEKDSLKVIDAMLERNLIPQVNILLFIPETTQDEIIHSMNQGVNIVEKGGQIVVSPLIYSLPGSPLYNDTRYEKSIEKHISPINNATINVANYFIPQDPQLAQMASKIVEKTNDEINAFEKSGKWNYGRIPKALIGILTFIATSKLMKRDDLTQDWLDFLYLLAENKRLGIRDTHRIKT